MNTWLDHFDCTYGPLLDLPLHKNIAIERRNGFHLLFKKLIDNNRDSYRIIETGTLRNIMQWSDGQSAFLFVEFVKHFNGKVESVDIDPEACKTATDYLSPEYFSVTCTDSVEWLSNQSLQGVDLFYLDSYDVKFKDDFPSAHHHLQEFKIIEPFLKKGSIVAIDDNIQVNSNRSGKGRLIYEYLFEKKIVPIYDNYQLIYEF